MLRPSVDSGDSAGASLSESDSGSDPDSYSDPEPDSGSDPGLAKFPIPTASGGVMLQKKYKIHNFTVIIPGWHLPSEMNFDLWNLTI